MDKQNRKVRYTRKVLAESLIELMQARPVSAISIKELCALADINRSTFYDHYKSPYDILRQIEDAALEALDNIQVKSAFLSGKTEQQHFVEGILQFIIDNKNWSQVLMSEHGDIQFQRKLFSFIQQKGLIKFKKSDPVDERAKAYYLVFALNGSIALIQQWVKNGMDIPKDKMARMLIKLNRQE
ncbi:MAG: TetR/AcrR family transcriptional regulator [Treponema sp.]|jgi:AcrR family transcriptional regulator|nr:TetR/AcrR family transcriptional regulator [Treponema sp.]